MGPKPPTRSSVCHIYMMDTALSLLFSVATSPALATSALSRPSGYPGVATPQVLICVQMGTWAPFFSRLQILALVLVLVMGRD